MRIPGPTRLPAARDRLVERLDKDRHIWAHWRDRLTPAWWKAAARSGARHTVAWSEALGRVVMAVPGPVTSAMSFSPNRLIGEGQARLMTRAGDVLDNLAAAAVALVAAPAQSGHVWEHVSGPVAGRPNTASVATANRGHAVGL